MGVVYPFPETDEVIYMKRAAEKLKSSRGASLMMALLLFLVCAVVGSAVLTAGTAASGRMAKIAESDQRYYSVNSAANLLIDLLHDQTAMIEKVETKTSSGTSTDYKLKDSAGNVCNVTDTSFPSFALETASLIAADKTSLTVSLSSGETKLSPIAAVKETISPDGKLVFEISSTGGTDIYTLVVTFAADKRETKNVELKDDKTITTTVTSYTWKLSDVK